MSGEVGCGIWSDSSTVDETEHHNGSAPIGHAVGTLRVASKGGWHDHST